MKVDDAGLIYHGLDFISCLSNCILVENDPTMLPSQFIAATWIPFCQGISKLDTDSTKELISKIEGKGVLFMHILR